mgnify:CR=1 FL=1
MTAEELNRVNSEIPKVDIKGKSYAMVKDRIAAFRQICPNGTIETEVVSNNNGSIIMKAIIKDGANVLATGTAWERQSSNRINETSYVENCETSCVGRALGFIGIGTDESIASAEEVANAIINQNKPKITEYMVKKIEDRCEQDKIDPKTVCNTYRVEKLGDILFEDWSRKPKDKISLEEWAFEGKRQA